MNAGRTALLLGLLTGLLLLLGGLGGGRAGILAGLLIAAATNFLSYWFSDRIVLRLHGARPLPREAAPRAHAVLERLAGRAGLPIPAFYLLPESAANAFATGRGPRHGAVAVTQGLLEVLDEEELEGVLAHELSHVRNRDILIGTVAATLAGAVMVAAHFARWAAWSGGFGGREGRRENPLGLLLAALLAPVAAVLIQLAVSRSREYGADAAAAALVGHPHGLARALEKMETSSRRTPLRRAHPSTAHLFLVAPGFGGAWRRLFSTHPPIPDRIRRLLRR